MAASRIRGRNARRVGSRSQTEEIPDRQRRGENQQQRPKREQAVSAFVGIVVEKQRAEREDKRRGQQSEGRDAASKGFAERQCAEAQARRRCRAASTAG